MSKKEGLVVCKKNLVHKEEVRTPIVGLDEEIGCGTGKGFFYSYDEVCVVREVNAESEIPHIYYAELQNTGKKIRCFVEK